MNNLDNYLPKDAGRAANELRCLYDLRKRQDEAIAQGNFDQALFIGNNITYSLEQLGFLRERKLNQEKLKKVVIELEDQGILVAIVKKAHE
ncbi:hypothetical protein [Halobacillus litoralis]|uniref:Uncharacterized protein n=1 Tax=Halobacillus litoralis TaxID=45668 RepID=A0A410MDX4_9BACI|nr:hypothetical protein [Halobacillus litoralis]QAS52836.1 hypothetical protein HLI_11830 [Halobacillus litoralis]